MHGENNDKDNLINVYNTYLRRCFPNSEPIWRLNNFFDYFSVWLDVMLPLYSFLHCVAGVWKSTMPLWRPFCFLKCTPPISYFFVFPGNTWRVSWDKRKPSLRGVFLELRLIGIMPTLTQPCVMCTLIRINLMSLSFNLHLMQCKLCQYSFCLVPGLQELLVGCWELGDNVKFATWVVVKHFEKFPGLFAQQLTGVNILPQKCPEWYIYSGMG